MEIGKEFLSKLKIPTQSGDNIILPLNKGTEHFVDNLDNGISTFIRIPRQNYMTLTNLCYAIYILATTSKDVLIHCNRLENARININRIEQISEINNLNIDTNRIFLNPHIETVVDILGAGNIGMIIYDNEDIDKLTDIKIYPNILTTFSSIYGNIKILEDKLKENNIEYLEYSYKEIGRDENWFRTMCSMMNHEWEYINKEVLLKY